VSPESYISVSISCVNAVILDVGFMLGGYVKSLNVITTAFPATVAV